MGIDGIIAITLSFLGNADKINPSYILLKMQVAPGLPPRHNNNGLGAGGSEKRKP